MVQVTDGAEVSVEIIVYVNGEKVMAYGMLDAWPMDDRSAVDRIEDAGKAVYKQFRENF